MDKLALVLWLIGWPLAISISSYLDAKRLNKFNPMTPGQAMIFVGIYLLAIAYLIN